VSQRAMCKLTNALAMDLYCDLTIEGSCSYAMISKLHTRRDDSIFYSVFDSMKDVKDTGQ